MSFFDDVVANVKVIATNVGQKASQIKDYSKLKYSENGIRNEISKKKLKLGDYVYECSKTGDIDKIVMQQFVEEINELEENLQITLEMIANAKNKVTCDFCKAENEKDSVYCRKCGQKLKVKEEVEENTCECDCCQVKNDEVEDKTPETTEEKSEEMVAEEVVEDKEEKSEETVAEEVIEDKEEESEQTVAEEVIEDKEEESEQTVAEEAVEEVPVESTENSED